MPNGSATKIPKSFELEIPKSLDWELIKDLEKNHQDNFESAWAWGLKWRKVHSYFPLVPFSLIATSSFIIVRPSAYSLESSIGWVFVGLIWTFSVCFWVIVLDRWLGISWNLERIGRKILTKFSRRYRFWVAIRNAVAQASLSESLLLETSYLLLNETLKKGEETLRRAEKVFDKVGDNKSD